MINDVLKYPFGFFFILQIYIKNYFPLKFFRDMLSIELELEEEDVRDQLPREQFTESQTPSELTNKNSPEA